uniref:Uncharacterized protein n=1 Tax=Parascaris equorum TaxID=6256 RepID=A0A914RB41_PAREQ
MKKQYGDNIIGNYVELEYEAFNKNIVNTNSAHKCRWEVSIRNHLGSLGETEDDVPQSLIENARKAEPHASQKDKYLPENFDVAQFNFKGPLVIEHKPVFTTVHLFVTQCPIYELLL